MDVLDLDFRIRDDRLTLIRDHARQSAGGRGLGRQFVREAHYRKQGKTYPGVSA